MFLTAVEDGCVDPALGVAHGQLGASIAEQDVRAACPGSRWHSVGVVAAPAPHQHSVVVAGIQLNFHQEAEFSISHSE